ncbi:hypothetical protein KFK09_000674 [Dendrobium nobile]|uniref:Uncharacterized protein n=1 Tax=Dendrobium nobile TaxID=94219 RepID=A0A8T3CCJ9_DENNO|nr:hypothetical protein KFK09_000674 [Dendrobium nobile]
MPPSEPQIAAASASQPAPAFDTSPESIGFPILIDLRRASLTKVLDRYESSIGNANPKSIRSNSKILKSGSMRITLSVKPESPIIALPSKIISTTTSLQSFPMKISVGLGRKTAVSERDPESPKVSCFGNVLLERERSGEKAEGCWASLVGALRCGRVKREEGSGKDLGNDVVLIEAAPAPAPVSRGSR